MLSSFSRAAIAAVVASLCLLSVAHAASTPEDQFAATIKLLLAKSFNNDWEGLEKLPGIRWARLPPTMLDNCLPDGGCFTRQGTMSLAGRNLTVIASGARTIVSHVYFRNSGAPIGEPAVLAALKRAGLSAELARCPVAGGAGGTNWYRIKSAATAPGYLSIQTSCNRKACEGFAVSLGRRVAATAAQPVKPLLGAMLGRSFRPQASLHRDPSRPAGDGPLHRPAAPSLRPGAL